MSIHEINFAHSDHMQTSGIEDKFTMSKKSDSQNPKYFNEL